MMVKNIIAINFFSSVSALLDNKNFFMAVGLCGQIYLSLCHKSNTLYYKCKLKTFKMQMHAIQSRNNQLKVSPHIR